MTDSPLRALPELGQSVWLDFLGRGLIASGTLKRLMTEDGVSGVTSNPAIFGQAIGGSTDYDDDIRALSREGCDVDAIYRHLTVRDVSEAADLLRPHYDRTNGADGYVSLEVSPHLAYDTQASIAEARELWASTSVKNPAYPNTLYVEPLIGPNTVTTLPLETIDIYRAHGRPASTVTQGQAEAEADLSCLRALGIDLDLLTQSLEDEAVQKFITPHDALMGHGRHRRSVVARPSPAQSRQPAMGKPRSLRSLEWSRLHAALFPAASDRLCLVDGRY